MAQNGAIPSAADKQAEIYTEYKSFFDLSLGLIVLLVALWLGTHLFAAKLDDYGINLYTDVLGVIVTVLILDKRAEIRAREQLKQRLIREAGSRANSTAVSAIDWLRHEGWLEGEKGVLQGRDLHDAELSGADLHLANLLGTDMMCAKMQKADLVGAYMPFSILGGACLDGASLFAAYLQSADLRGSSLQRANLSVADLQGANLTIASLQDASIEKACLQGADLSATLLHGANFSSSVLQGANLWNAEFDETTIWPDGKSYSDPEELVRRFGVRFEKAEDRPY